MSKINDLATIQILSNINEKKISNLSDKSKKKDNSNEKNNCVAAVRYNTIGNAYKDRMNNVSVYLIKEEKNGNMKTHAYSRCSKTTQDGTNFCHLHCRMTKYNNEGLKIFEKDILPSNPNDKTRWLANINDDFFENMGKRGAKKKNGENNFTFPDENHPILLILTHKNAKLATQLSLYASQLLKNSNYVCPEIMTNDIKKVESKKKEIIKTDNTLENISNLISMISTIDKSSQLLKKSNINQDDKSKESYNDEIEENKSKEKKSKKNELKDNESDNDSDNESDNKSDNESDKGSDNESDNKSDNESDNESDKESDKESDNKSDKGSYNKSDNEDNNSDEGVSCIPIYTNKKKLLWYNEDNKAVYEPEGDDSGEEIGFLKEISMEYHTIIHNEKFYTVLNELKVKDKGNIYYCVLTDSLFDKKLNFIGIRTKIKNNQYRFDFNK